MFRRTQGVLASVVAVVIASATLVAAPAVSAKPKPPPVPLGKAQVVNFTIDVAGYLDVAQYHDTTADCQVGIRYIQTNRAEFETAKPVKINLTFTRQPGGGTAITSRFTEPAGSATAAGLLSNQHSSNVCEGPPEPLPPFPNCTSTTGTFAVSFQPGDEATGDLTALNGQALGLSLARLSGNSADPSCIAPGADSVTGPGMQSLGIASTSVPGAFAVLPTGLRSLQLFKAKKGTTFKRSVVITGPCSNVTVYDVQGATPTLDLNNPPPFSLNADGDCQMRGSVVIILKRL